MFARACLYVSDSLILCICIHLHRLLCISLPTYMQVYIIGLLGALNGEARGHAADFGPGFGAGVALEEATSLAKALRDGNRIYVFLHQDGELGLENELDSKPPRPEPGFAWRVFRSEPLLRLGDATTI